jgi:hypothetical protein
MARRRSIEHNKMQDDHTPNKNAVRLLNMPHIEIFRNCPRFKKCNVNNCPLSSSYPNGFVSPGDREQKCSLAKKRLTLGTSLKYKGLTLREFKGLNSWMMKPLAEQQRVKNNLRVHSFPTKVKGCEVVPIKKTDIDCTETQSEYIPCYQRLAPKVDNLLTLEPTLSSRAIAERLDIGKDTVIKAKKYIHDSKAAGLMHATL